MRNSTLAIPAARPFTLTGTVRTMFGGLVLLGVVAAAAGAVVAPERMWANWLLIANFLLGIGLAGLCFLAIHYTTGATWSVAIRRVPEALAGMLFAALPMMAAVLLLYPQLYGWWDDPAMAGAAHPAAAFKNAWLSRPFFLVRAAVYGGTWLFFASVLRARSRRQDRDRDPRWSRDNVRLSAALLVLFGITVTLASFDWLMSLEHHWFSTIYGVYNFAGVFESGLAAIILVTLWLEHSGALRGVVQAAHLHDLGKLLFAFSVFWAYIWFSQYMLIWYTDIPEETIYFVKREQGGWFALSMSNLMLNGVLPFCLLLRQDAKQHRRILASAAAIVLAGRWLDLYLMIFPSSQETPVFGVWEIGLTAGGLGLFGLMLARELTSAAPVPLADPDLPASLGAGH